MLQERKVKKFAVLFAVISIMSSCVARSTQQPATNIDWRKVPGFVSVERIDSGTIWVTTAMGHDLFRLEPNGASGKPAVVKVRTGVRRVAFADEQFGVLATDTDRLWKTMNGGRDWEQVVTEKRFVYVSDLWVADRQNVWLLDRSELYHSGDGGLNWSRLFGAEEDPQALVGDLQFLGDRGWICDVSQGIVLTTVDAGRSWSRAQIGTPLKYGCSIAFGNPSNGWLLSGRYPNQDLFGTLDGGSNWLRVVDFPKGFEAMSIHRSIDSEFAAGYFHNPRTDFIQNGRGAILKFDPAHGKWEEIDTGISTPFFDRIVTSGRDLKLLISRDSIYSLGPNGGWTKIFGNDIENQ